MMKTIQGVARFNIPPEKLSEFKALARQCVELSRQKDTGTIRYELFFNADETKCIVHEEYVDSAACMAHFKHMGETADAIFATAAVSGEMWGDLSPELKQAVGDKGVVLYTPFISLDDEAW